MTEVRVLADKAQMVALSKLDEFENNSRVHTETQVAQIAASMQQWGFTLPILADESMVIIAGHARARAARKLGMSKVPVVIAEGWTDEQKRAYVIADNQLAMNSEWNEQLLASEIAGLNSMEFDLGLLGFGDAELTRMLEPDQDEQFGEDDVPEVPEAPPVSQTGDVWVMGAHRLAVGDCTDPEVVARLCEGDPGVNVLLTDPPYNVDYQSKSTGKKIKNDSMAHGPFLAFLTDAFGAAKQVLRPGAAFYIWHGDGEYGLEFRMAARAVGWQVRQCLIWRKNAAVMGRQDYQWKHEPALYGHDAGGEPEPSDLWEYEEGHDGALYGWTEGEAHKWFSDRKQTTVLDFDKPKKSEDHPTMKPVALFERLIRNSCTKDGIVLDIFAGSGTTLIAAIKRNRVARLCELDPVYADVIVRRYMKFTGLPAVLAETGEHFENVQQMRHESE